MDKICIEDLEIPCVIGACAWERSIEQVVVVSLEMDIDARYASRTDRLEDAVDYGQVAEGVRTLVQASRFTLLETLAEEVARTCLGDHRVHAVKVLARKPGAVRGARDVGVEIVRDRITMAAPPGRPARGVDSGIREEGANMTGSHAGGAAARPLIIVFIDLAHFWKATRELSDLALFDLMAEWFERVGDMVEAAGGKLVKTIGDAALISFPPDDADGAIETLIRLRSDTDRWFENRGHECHLTLKVHLGKAVAGYIGARTEKRWDLYGQAVCQAAMLPGDGFWLSDTIHQALGEDLQRQFEPEGEEGRTFRAAGEREPAS